MASLYVRRSNDASRTKLLVSFLKFNIHMIIVITVSSFIRGVPCLPDSPKLTYEDLYKTGVDAYLDERWYECVSSIERALEDYFYYRTSLIHCQSFCKNASENYIFSSNNEVDKDKAEMYHEMFSVIVKDALCLMKCEKTLFRERPPTLNRQTVNDFENKVPYNYLQLCYFKIGDAQKAASCAYTFLIHNPNHEVMHKNLKYYLDQPTVQMRKVKYLEAKDYQELYMEAAKAYREQKWETVIELMEKAVKKFLKAEDECRLLCEGSVSSLPEAELLVNVANHYTYALRCKNDCAEKLSFMYGQKQENFFASLFHYLQYSYYKINNLEKACGAVGSYLLLQPTDQIMQDNRGYYLDLENVQEHWFEPRPEVEVYVKRQKKEIQFLEFIEDSFNFPDPLEPAQFSVPTQQEHSQNSKRKFKSRTSEEFSAWSSLNGIRIVQKDSELNGSLRFTADGFASRDECNTLITLAQEGAVHGDGYNGKQSPHTEFEQFEGLTVGRAATLTEKGILDGFATQLLLNVSEKARTYVEMYFGLKSKLYFAYTHLVCRTAISGSPDIRNDLSHPVHADNCLLLNTGECVKQKPAYIWRDYSAIVYLNEDFEGGDFIFAKDKNTVQAHVKPKCGRMVGFSAGKENLHGVEAVTKGKRCALAMWYTLDPTYQERERLFAEQVLTEVIQKKKKEEDVDVNTLNLVPDTASSKKEVPLCPTCNTNQILPDFGRTLQDASSATSRLNGDVSKLSREETKATYDHVHDGL